MLVNGGGSRSLLQEIEAQQSVGLWDINLIYYLKGDQISDPDFKFADDERNILTEEHVAAIKEFEDSLLALPSFQVRGLRVLCVHVFFLGGGG